MSTACPASPERQEFARSGAIVLIEAAVRHLEHRASKKSKPNYWLLDGLTLDVLLPLVGDMYKELERVQHWRLDQSSIHREAA